VLIAVSLVYWLSLSLSGPFQLRLVGAPCTRPRLRGRIVGALGSAKAAAAAVAALIGGLAADQFGRPAAMLVAGAVGAVLRVGYAGLQAPTAERPKSFSARDSIRALARTTRSLATGIAQGFYGGGLIAAAPLYAIVHVDRLDLSMADVGILAILSAASNTLAVPRVGVVADRRGPTLAMRIGALLGLVSLIAYCPGARYSRAVPGVGRGRHRRCLDRRRDRGGRQRPHAARVAARAMAGWNALTGARGIVAAFAMSILLQLGSSTSTAGCCCARRSRRIGVALFGGPALGAVAAADRARSSSRRTARRRGRPRVPARPSRSAAPRDGPAPRRRATMAAMRLDAQWEEERLLVFSRRRAGAGAIARPARAQRARGDRADLRRDARGGEGAARYADVEAAGRAAVAPDDVMPASASSSRTSGSRS
jgi:hypothetical protein